jgi:hypothetical protein
MRDLQLTCGNWNDHAAFVRIVRVSDEIMRDIESSCRSVEFSLSGRTESTTGTGPSSTQQAPPHPSPLPKWSDW